MELFLCSDQLCWSRGTQPRHAGSVDLYLCPRTERQCCTACSALLCTVSEKWSKEVFFFISLRAFSELIFLPISSHSALFYFLWGSRQDVHDDVQTLAERSPWQGIEASTSALGWNERQLGYLCRSTIPGTNCVHKRCNGNKHVCLDEAGTLLWVQISLFAWNSGYLQACLAHAVGVSLTAEVWKPQRGFSAL